MATQISLRIKLNRVMAALGHLVASDRPATADLKIAGLTEMLQSAANVHLLALIVKKREELRTSLTAVVSKTAPGAVAETADDISVLCYVIMGDTALMAELNAEARKAGIKDVMAFLKAALLVE